MLVNEAKWFSRGIEQFDDLAFPMLNVGSHTADFRRNEQPWIDHYLFAPLHKRGCKVVHSDLRDGEGIDLVGDLTDPAFLARLASMRFGSIFCANLLEHVPNPRAIADSLVRAVRPGGYLLISCPHHFPFHPDPIDTMFRPSIAELSEQFAGTTLEKGEIVNCGNLTTYMLGRMIRSPSALGKNLLKRRRQVVKQTAEGMSASQWIPWLWRTFRQTCVILKRPDSGADPQ